MRFSTILWAAAFSGIAFAQKNNAKASASKASTSAAAGGGGGATGTTLDANAIQTSVDGSAAGGAAEPGQALSATSTNNFINNCGGKTLTNGLQVQGGSCNGIPMGDMPSKANMISAVITNPQTGGNIAASTTFNVSVQMANLVAGSFTNAATTYYSAPQALSGGKVVGHTHVTIQDMGNSLNPAQPLDATKFAFFKGINDAGNGNGLLSATVTGGLPAGNYRVCSMTSASNHQPVLMPVAQRGAQDDCTKFTVGGAGGGGAGAGGGNAKAGNNNNSKVASSATATSSATAATGSAAKAKGKGKGGARKLRARSFIQ